MIYAQYQDDGPAGPCGQSSHTTSPWNILYKFTTEEDLKAFKEQNMDARKSGRRNARITNVWSDTYEQRRPDGVAVYGECYPGKRITDGTETGFVRGMYQVLTEEIDALCKQRDDYRHVNRQYFEEDTTQ